MSILGMTKARLRREQHLGGLEAQAKLASHFADQLVSLWHDAREIHDESLAQFMGLTEEQYAAWVECRWEDVGV